MDINHVQLVGNTTRDPEIKRTSSGQELTKVTVATNYSWIDSKSKKKRESSEFHHVVAWGKIGELVGKYLHKGEKVMFEGRLVTKSWEVKGVKHYQTQIVANNFILLSARKTADKIEVLAEEPSLEEIDED